jgi:cbb3-type cytochrome oxidase maturation protein
MVIMSTLLLGFAIWAFFWAVKNNQFEDLDTPAYSMLDDKDKAKTDEEE